MDEVTLLVECADGESPLERLEADLRQALGVRIDCRAVPAGTLPRAELKAQRLIRVPSPSEGEGRVGAEQ
jgi:phenylacetate-coenzyme A ligase PaaK-like adenylate-forming protein